MYGLAPYDLIAPPLSYINVLDYNSVEDLAKHLSYLNTNDTAYNEYFRSVDRASLTNEPTFRSYYK